jgi:DNA-binding NarL/FixJ family response regulator
MSSPRLALIEGHEMVRQLFARHLSEELGYNLVGQAGTAVDAHKLLPKHRPDLVIIDWSLPDSPGTEVVRALAPELPQSKWLLLSAREHGPLVREAALLGVQGVVSKRSSLSVLAEAVRRVLAGEVFYCPFSSRLLTQQVVSDAAGRPRLTAREREVLRGFARGENSKLLAARLGMNVKTVQNHLTTLKDKLGIREPAELVRYAMKHGYVDTI